MLRTALCAQQSNVAVIADEVVSWGIGELGRRGGWELVRRGAGALVRRGIGEEGGGRRGAGKLYMVRGKQDMENRAR